ncbi:MAG: caspase family protein [Hyphomicrobium sp.]
MNVAAADLGALRMHGRVYSPQGEQKSIGTMMTCASLGLKYMEALIKGDDVGARAIEGKLSDAKCDPRWASTLSDYYSSYLDADGARRLIPYRRAAKVGTAVITIQSNARIAIVGDWGTGAIPAIRVARQIAQLKPDILVHLGDIYYSGTPNECKMNFIDILDDVFDRARTKLPVFTLAGNHDMYSGGTGYYSLIDRLNEESMQQRASFFCLRSYDNKWQLLGMDTGLNDYAPLSVTETITRLEADEEQWHIDRIEEFPGKTILLSHHQLFSSFSQIGAENEQGQRCAHNPRLLESYEKFVKTGKTISAWFWGHEHSLYLYDGHLNLSRGRCLGHGAIPVFASEEPYSPLKNLRDAPSIIKSLNVGHSGDVYANGFAMLELQSEANNATVRYFQDMQGVATEVFSESLVAASSEGATKPEVMAPFAESIFFSPQAPNRKKRSRKFAFVVGNQHYRDVAKLTNPAADAGIVRTELEQLGFAVYGGVNFDLSALRDRFDYFESQIGEAEVALLYYSGHGVQINGQNYLVPIDGSMTSLLELARETQIQNLVDRMSRKSNKCLVFLDACRDNPFIESIAEPESNAKRVGLPEIQSIAALASRGLAPIDVRGKAQTFIAFAAAPGKYAYGSDGRYSYFTQGLVSHLDTQGLDIDGLMNRVRRDVKGATSETQDPWSQTNLTEDYYFRPASLLPAYVMALLGALSGFATAWRTFDPTGLYQNGWNGWGGAFFGLVVGAGVWRWGRRSLWGACLAFLSVTLAFKLAFFYMNWIGTIEYRSDRSVPFFENAKLMRDFIGASIAASICMLGAILGAGATTPALRRPSAYIMMLFAGILVVPVVGLVMTAQSFPFPGLDKDDYDRLAAIIGAMCWQAGLGFTIGYGLSQYVPEPGERGR